MATQTLSEKNKYRLLKKIRNSATTLKYLSVALTVTLIAAAVAYSQKWISPDFPAYLLLLALLLVLAAGVSVFEIINIRKALSLSRKKVISGLIARKTCQPNEFSTAYAFEINGATYNVRSKHFEAFQEGETVQIELSVPGNELLKVKRTIDLNPG